MEHIDLDMTSNGQKKSNASPERYILYIECKRISCFQIMTSLETRHSVWRKSVSACLRSLSKVYARVLAPRSLK